MLQSTLNLLSQLGVSFEEARNFIHDNVSQPDYIYQTAGRFNITFDMIADLYGDGVTGDDVKGFFKLNGMSVENDTPDYTPDVFSGISEPNNGSEVEEDDSKEDLPEDSVKKEDEQQSGGSKNENDSENSFDLSDFGLDGSWLASLQNQLEGFDFTNLTSGLEESIGEIITGFNQEESSFLGDFNLSSWIEYIRSFLSELDFSELSLGDAGSLIDFNSIGDLFNNINLNQALEGVFNNIDLNQALEGVLDNVDTVFDGDLSTLVGVPEFDPATLIG